MHALDAPMAADTVGDPFDVEAVWAAQRRNIEALSQANQAAMAGVQALATRIAAASSVSIRLPRAIDGMSSFLLLIWTIGRRRDVPDRLVHPHRLAAGLPPRHLGRPQRHWCGSSASAIASPSRLNARIVAMIARPGSATTRGSVR